MSLPPLIDCHAHLQDSLFDADREPVLDRAGRAGVRLIVTNGSFEGDWAGVLDLARRRVDVLPCLGLHPWYVAERSPAWLDRLGELLLGHRAAVGEIGLDRWLVNRDEPAQEQVFRAQMELAARLHRPVTIHCLRAWPWLMDVLRSLPALPPAMIFHAYGGSVEMIAPLAAMGGYFSFAGTVLAPRRTKARRSLAAVPRDRLLLETDAPDLTPPAPYAPFSIERVGDSRSDRDGQTLAPGQLRNEPANLRAILGGLAALMGVSEAELAQQVWDNARRILSPYANFSEAERSRPGGAEGGPA